METLSRHFLTHLVWVSVPFLGSRTIIAWVKLTDFSLDVTTSGNCLASKSQFKKKGSIWAIIPGRFRRHCHKWFDSASLSRWLTTNILCALTIGTTSYLLYFGTIQVHLENPFSLGFGAINRTAFVDIGNQDGKILASILLANVPQLLLSFLYFGYNALWTCMLLAQEWSSYASKRKSLRVTAPTGTQRSTYRLQLPYRYGIPLLVISVILHWLVSQSIFLVVLEAYAWDGNPLPDSDNNHSLCGYSPVAILTAVITGSLALITSIANGFRRYPVNGIPLTGSCSAAISAACHPPAGDDQASRKPVMWGACGSEKDGARDEGIDLGSTAYDAGKETLRWQEGGEEQVTVGHCSFTSFDVEAPVEGEFYAGLKERRR